MIFFRTSAVTDCLCMLRIQRTCILCFPVKLLSCFSHLVINVSCSRHALSNICRMSRNLGSNDSLLHIINIWQCQMFCRCYIAQECSSAHSGYCSTDCTCNVIISRCNISYDRSQYIEWSSHADALLDLHIGCHLIKRYMSRSFYHNLYIMCPRTFGKFSQTY